MDGVGEVAGGLAELAFAASYDNKGKPNPVGCLVTLLILVAIGLGIYFYNKPVEKVAPLNKECGTLILKLKDNEVIVLLNNDKDNYIQDQITKLLIILL